MQGTVTLLWHYISFTFTTHTLTCVSLFSTGFFLQDLPTTPKKQTVVNKGAVNKVGVKSSGGPEFSRPEFRDSSVRKWNGPILNDVYVNDVYVNGPYINDFSSTIYNYRHYEWRSIQKFN